MLADCITGPISKQISHHGIKSVYDSLPDADKPEFERAYKASTHTQPHSTPPPSRCWEGEG